MNTIQFLSAVQNREQLKTALKNSLYVVIPPELADKPDEKIIIAAPRIFADIKILKKLRERGFDKLLCHTVDAIETAAELGYKAFGGYGLNITNSVAAGVFNIPFIASIEAKSFDTKYMKNCAVYAYGRFPVMTTVQKFSSETLTDRTNRHFKLKKSRHYTEILNANRLSLSGKKIIADYLFLDFYDESTDEMEKIYKAFSVNMNIPAADRENITRGLYI